MLIFFNLGALYYTGSSSPPTPDNVIFSSVNLRNVLHWLPGNGTPDETHFTVQYAIYGDSVEGSKGRRLHWRLVQRCTEIIRTWCDLSNETWDLEQGYYARVRAVSSRRASSKWVSTLRFDPKSDTSFGPPLVSVEINDNSAIITLKGPMRHRPNNQTPLVSMATLYPHMMYNLSINNTRSGKTSYFPVVSSPYIHRLMEYNTEYCFSAKTKFLSMPIHCHSSAWQCTTTPKDPLIGQLQKVVVAIVVTSACIGFLAVGSYLLHYYLTGKGQKTPEILRPPHFSKPPWTLPSESPSLLFIAIMKPSEITNGVSETTHPVQQQHNTEPPPYAPQGTETPAEPEGPWDDLSVDYGFVGVASNIHNRDEEEDRKKRHDRGEDGRNPGRIRQKDLSRDSCENKEWIVENGHFAGIYAPQKTSYLSQKSTHTCSQTHTPIHTQRERCTLIQAQTFSQANSASWTQTQSPPQFPGLFKKTTETDLFHAPVTLNTNHEGELGEEMDGKVRVPADEDMDEGVTEESESERSSLLSAYVSHNIKDMSTSYTDQSDFLSKNYGVLRLAAAGKIEEDEEEEEEEDGTLRVDWDPMTGKLVLPGIAREFSKEAWSDNLMQEEKRRENRLGGVEEEVNMVKDEPTLENVFVRQASEEEEEADRKSVV